MRYGLQHQVIWSGAPAGLPTNITTLADHLSAGGYATHAIGKWHAGYYSWDHTPTFRGFDSYLGYYGVSCCTLWPPECSADAAARRLFAAAGSPRACHTQAAAKATSATCLARAPRRRARS